MKDLEKRALFLEGQMKTAMEVIWFYAARKNWEKGKISSCDIERYGEELFHGGARARDFLLFHNIKEDELHEKNNA